MHLVSIISFTIDFFHNLYTRIYKETMKLASDNKVKKILKTSKKERDKVCTLRII